MIALVEIDWADNIIGEEMQGLFGPFESADAATDWALSQIRNGEWSVVTPQTPLRAWVAGTTEL